MSDIASNNYQRHLFGEDQAELLEAEVMAQAAAAAATVGMFALGKRNTYQGRAEGARTVKRKRLDVDDHFSSMDHRLFRRKYRMGKASFYKLLDILRPYLPSTGEVRSRPGSVPNGPISKASRLSMALRYCAGGDPTDICDHHGVKDREVLRSVWYVVDAIHAAPQLNITFPQTHAEQAIVAQGFKEKSDIDIDVCCGAIDGILIWIHKPSKKDVQAIGCGPAKFFCGRKKKFGLNMQAVCDARGRFLDVEIKFPGSTSDFFAFEQSKVKAMIAEDGFLRPGLCLFGDNAYVNAPYMCVPFRNVPPNTPEDAFNFFQSQIRINIECAFGILVHRFGLLRKPIPMNIDVHKTNSLVLALCKLHIFCIEQNCELLPAHQSDVTNIVLREGGMYRPRIDDDGEARWSYDESQDRVAGLLDGGQHCDDHTTESRRRFRRNDDLPHKSIFRTVCRDGHRRPDRSTYRRM
ncbi:hypothetical protein ACHAXT_001260 [Thalassiosira profunda]